MSTGGEGGRAGPPPKKPQKTQKPPMNLIMDVGYSFARFKNKPDAGTEFFLASVELATISIDCSLTRHRVEGQRMFVYQ